jgi:hypothetical protein
MPAGRQAPTGTSRLEFIEQPHFPVSLHSVSVESLLSSLS